LCPRQNFKIEVASDEKVGSTGQAEGIFLLQNTRKYKNYVSEKIMQVNSVYKYLNILGALYFPDSSNQGFRNIILIHKPYNKNLPLTVLQYASHMYFILLTSIRYLTQVSRQVYSGHSVNNNNWFHENHR
jgi:hypothetical protein